VGGVAGGLAGKAVAEQIDPTVEDAYWREKHPAQPYADSAYSYDRDYAPAYRLGYQGYANRPGKWEDAEYDLEREWEEFKADSRLNWEKAKAATRAGWHKVERALPGDADRDGR
jgi:hypothetical protein